MYISFDLILNCTKIYGNVVMFDGTYLVYVFIVYWLCVGYMGEQLIWSCSWQIGACRAI